MIWLEIIVVLGAIFFGIRLGGIGIGLCGGLGLAILTLGFGLQIGSPPVDVILITGRRRHGLSGSHCR